MPELSTLHELVAQFRRRADTAKATRNGHIGEGRKIDAERLEGKRQAYTNAADELERELGRIDAPDAP